MAGTTRTSRAYTLALIVIAFCGMTLTAWRGSAGAEQRNASVSGYAAVLRSFNPGLSSAQAQDIAEHVLLLSSYYSLDPRLLVAIVAAESGWHADAVSPTGALGLGQLMPSTANALAVQPFEKYENLDGTARYLRRLLKRYANLPVPIRYERALAGYNAGPEAVARYGGVPPYAQTRAYVVRVMTLWRQVDAMLANLSAPIDAHPLAPSYPAAASPAPFAMKPRRVTVPQSRSVSRKAISAISLSVPQFVADGEPIPVSLRVRGSGTVLIVARIGPKVIERRAVPSSTTKLLLHPVSPAPQTRLVTVRATAGKVRSHETVVAAVAP